MDHRDEIEALRAGTLEIDCRDIKLVQDTPANPKTYLGPGVIKQSKSGDIIFKVYVTSVRNTDAACDLKHRIGLQAGTIVVPEEYYTLSALDYHGRTWSAANIVPNIAWHGTDYLLAGGGIDVLSSQTSPHVQEPCSTSSIRLH